MACPQLAVLEVRSKNWGRVVPAAGKGRSQSAPRGALARRAPLLRSSSHPDEQQRQVPCLACQVKINLHTYRICGLHSSAG